MDSAPHLRKYKISFAGAIFIFMIVFVLLIWRDVPDTNLVEYFKGGIKFFLNFIPGAGFSIPRGTPELILDLLLFFVIYASAISFFAQFALPVHNLGQRVQAFLYLIRYPLFHGPLAFIEDGRHPTDYPQGEVKKRGILLFDTASAALLRRRATFTRSVGPGLVFTGKGEYLAGEVDLHRVAWPAPPTGMGPTSGEDPFAPRNEKEETIDQYQKREERRFSTSGETRDGVEIVANIFVVSQLDSSVSSNLMMESRPWSLQDWLERSKQSDVHTGFGYSPEAVRLAITGEEIDPSVSHRDRERQHLPWYQLPTYLAIDLWREYLRKFTFEELFRELPAYPNPDKPGQNLTAYQVIQRKVKERLTLQDVDDIDRVGAPGNSKPSPEFELLGKRGIKVWFAPIRNLRFPKEVDQQLEDMWFTTWKSQAMREREAIERLKSYRMHEGELDALRDFGYYATRWLGSRLINEPRSNDETIITDQMRRSLEFMLRGTLRQCREDSALHHRLAGEEKEIIEIVDWVRRNL